MDKLIQRIRYMPEPLRPNLERARMAVLFIWIVLAIQLITSLVSAWQLYLIDGYQWGNVELETLEFSDRVASIAGIARLGLFITSSVMFIRWFRRAYYNAGLLTGEMGYKESEAASAWFIPIVSLYKPVRIMQELYLVTRNTLRMWRADSALVVESTYVGIWWAAWVILNVWNNISVRLSLRADTPDEIIFGLTMDSLEVLGTVPLALLAVKVVRDYSAMEGQLVVMVDEVKAMPVAPPTNPTAEAQPIL